MAVVVSTDAKSDIMTIIANGLGSSSALLKNTGSSTVDTLDITLSLSTTSISNNAQLIFDVTASSGSPVTLDHVVIQSKGTPGNSIGIGLNAQELFEQNGIYVFNTFAISLTIQQEGKIMKLKGTVTGFMVLEGTKEFEEIKKQEEKEAKEAKETKQEVKK